MSPLQPTAHPEAAFSMTSRSPFLFGLPLDTFGETIRRPARNQRVQFLEEHHNQTAGPSTYSGGYVIAI
jgi:hypothetical protein